MHFYAVGVNSTHDNSRARLHAALHSSVLTREEVARKLFSKRFPSIDVSGKDVKELRGMEGYRIRQLYIDKGRKYGVKWRGRRYDKHRWSESDPINRAISCANSSLYALCTSAVCSLGYLPQLGFIHTAGTISFALDVADVFKGETSLEAAFKAVSEHGDPSADQVLTRLKTLVETTQLMRKIPLVLEEVMQ